MAYTFTFTYLSPKNGTDNLTKY